MRIAQERADRPADHVDRPLEAARDPQLTPAGWLRWGWRQLTSMRTALILLLLLALAAIPGSLIPQQSADPNGVIQFRRNYPEWRTAADVLQLHDVFGSVWFSAIYLLLFVSLVGCVIPRIRHHVKALLADPPATPRNLARLPAHRRVTLAGADSHEVLELARRELRRQRYRTVWSGPGRAASIAAERGFLRETGNLLFHLALLAVLLILGFGAGFRYTAQRILVEGQSFANTRVALDSFTPGRFVDPAQLPRFTLALDRFSVDYVEDNPNALGMPRAFEAEVTVGTADGAQRTATLRVNEPLSVDGADIYLLGNGYAPTVVVRDPAGKIVFSDSVPFLPQDANLTSLGVVKVPDGLAEQVGMIGFLYPTRAEAANGASYSSYPDLLDPIITLNVYIGDLGLDAGVPVSVYTLDTANLTQVAGGDAPAPAVQLVPGVPSPLPNGLGTVEVTTIPRFASLDIAHDPTQVPMLLAAIGAVAGLGLSLFVPRRRVWVRAHAAGGGVALEVAALARGDDPLVAGTVDALTAHLVSRVAEQKGAPR